MGIDMPARSDLIAAYHTESEIAAMVGGDSLAYLSLEGLRRALGAQDGNGFCFACFDGKYPLAVPQELEMDKLALEGHLVTNPVLAKT